MSDEERAFREAVAARIREARLARGLSVAEVERRSGIATVMLWRYERGEVMPSLYTLDRLARAMDVSPRDLMRGPRKPVREPMVCAPGAVMGTEMLDPELRNRVAGKERRG